MGESKKGPTSTTLAVVRRPADLSQARRRDDDDGRVVPGDVLDEKYRIEAVLGEGGMGYVVRARHLHLDRVVALKFMLGEVVSRDAKRRLLREARGVASLRSRHVARVLDVGTHRDGTPYIVMEYLEGKDLSYVLEERGVLGVGEACEYVMQACEALVEAHALGIVHRDLKLANLFLTRGFAGEPIIKVLDFGVSKVPDHGEDPSDLTMVDGEAADETLTRANDLLGSPRFMAPEQLLSARNADAQSDVWSLGVILFTLLAGRLPFDGSSIGELVQQIVRGHIPNVRDLRPDVPPGLAQVVAGCLQRDRNHRVRDCFELVRLLEPWVRTAAPSPERMTVLGQAFARATIVPGSMMAPPSVPTPSGASVPSVPSVRGMPGVPSAPNVPVVHHDERTKTIVAMLVMAVCITVLAVAIVTCALHGRG